jgi:hypothetical protein
VKQTIICDLDGTLANCEHRVHHVQSKPKNWDAFYAGIPDDEPNLPVLFVLRKFLEDFDYTKGEWIYRVVFMSGRPERCRKDTMTWLAKHVFDTQEPIDVELHMRADGDFRQDSIVKRELFEKTGIDPASVVLVLDDRQQVVDMWRSLGLTCWQVAPGDF